MNRCSQKRKWVGFSSAIAIGFLASAGISVGSVAGTIQGALLNGTSGQAGQVERLTLYRMEGDRMEIQTVENPSGDFRFENLDPAIEYGLVATYQGVEYEEIIQLEKESSRTVNLIVYDVTEELREIQVKMAFLFLGAMDNTLFVRKRFEIENPTNYTIVAKREPLRFYLSSERMSEATVAVTRDAAKETLVVIPAGGDKEYRLDYPLFPGSTIIDIEYQMPFASDSREYEEKLYCPAEPFPVFTFPFHLAASGEQMVKVGMDEKTLSNRYRTVERLEAGQSLQLTLSFSELQLPPGHPRLDRGLIQQVPTRLGRYQLYIVAVVVFLLLAATAVLLLRSKE